MTRILTAAALAAAGFAAGCDSGPRIVPVSGKVLIDGKPLEKGVVQVVPSGFRAASGEIGPDGRFRLTTLAENDGCVLGTHPVAVIAFENLGPTAQRWLAPKKYMDFSTSELTVDITGPTDALEINLTWAGGKPFIERTVAEK